MNGVFEHAGKRFCNFFNSIDQIEIFLFK